MPQVTPSIKSVPSSREPGSAMGSAEDSTDFNKGVSIAIDSDMEHKKISDISKHVLSVSVDYKTSRPQYVT